MCGEHILRTAGVALPRAESGDETFAGAEQ
jgi:hypothetical protein